MSRNNQAFVAALIFGLFAVPASAQPIFALVPGAPFFPGEGPFYSAVADFNGDGNLDVAFADEGNGGTLHVLLGDGHGGFVPGPGGGTAGGQPSGIIAADFNGDGIMDLAALTPISFPFGGSVIISLGDGKGGFRTVPGNVALLEGVVGFGVGDFNSDGFPDVAVSTTSALVILLGDGKGGLIRGASPSGRGAIAGKVAVGNFTGQGNSDVVVVNSQGLTVFASDGRGGFTALPIAPITSALINSNRIAAADLNGDGFPDLIVNANVFLNDGKGSFSAQPKLPITINTVPQPYTIADFNGDGYVDLGYADGNQVNILFGDGAGRFTPQPLS